MSLFGGEVGVGEGVGEADGVADGRRTGEAQGEEVVQKRGRRFGAELAGVGHPELPGAEGGVEGELSRAAECVDDRAFDEGDPEVPEEWRVGRGAAHCFWAAYVRSQRSKTEVAAPASMACWPAARITVVMSFRSSA